MCDPGGKERECRRWGHAVLDRSPLGQSTSRDLRQLLVGFLLNRRSQTRVTQCWASVVWGGMRSQSSLTVRFGPSSPPPGSTQVGRSTECRTSLALRFRTHCIAPRRCPSRLGPAARREGRSVAVGRLMARQTSQWLPVQMFLSSGDAIDDFRHHHRSTSPDRVEPLMGRPRHDRVQMRTHLTSIRARPSSLLTEGATRSRQLARGGSACRGSRSS